MLKRKLESNLRPRLRGQIWTRAAAALTLTVTPSLHESLLVLWDIGQSNQETEGTSSDDAVANILSQSGGGPESSSWDGGPNRTVKSYVLAVRFLSPHLIADRRLPLQRIISHGFSWHSVVPSFIVTANLTHRDHEPFHENGFPAPQLFERTGSHRWPNISRNRGYQQTQVFQLQQVEASPEFNL